MSFDKNNTDHSVIILQHRYKYFYIISAMFTTVLIAAMTLSGRMVPFGVPMTSFEFPAPAGVFIFPFLFALTDITTEVYGYRASLKIVWTGIFSLWAFTAYVYLSMHMPSPAGWMKNAAYNDALSILPRATFSSSIALIAGIASNSYVMCKSKILLNGKHYVSRALFSSMFGEAVLQILTMTITYFGTLNFTKVILPTIAISYLYKILFNIVAGSFITAPIQAKLKKAEEIDHYDLDTNFNPFSYLLK